MHDLDLTLKAHEMESDNEGWVSSGEYEMENEWEMEMELDEFEGPFSESEELELAAELLSVSEEAELDQFLGKLFKRVGRGFRKVFKPLGQVLRPLAKKILPIAGTAVGTFFGGPVGAALGGKLGSAAGNLFEMEMEGMGPEEQELEVARRFVRLAGSAASKAAAAPDSAPAALVAQKALKAAARVHAPGLLRSRPGSGGARPTAPGVRNRQPGGAPAPCRCGGHGGGDSGGRWIRRGNRIVLLGV